MELHDFLSSRGRLILKKLMAHVSKLGNEEVDEFELAMLANSFDLYAIAAKFVKDNGMSMSFTRKDAPAGFDDLDDDEKEAVRERAADKKQGGGYSQIRPEYVVMRTEYQNILKHSERFGLNPAARKKIFKMVDEKKASKKGFNTSMKVA